MFTIKLNTGKTIKANALSEDYSPSRGNSEKKYRLNIDSCETMDVDSMVEMLSEDTALDVLTVSAEGSEEEVTISGYTTIDTVSKRLTALGEWQFTIILLK